MLVVIYVTSAFVYFFYQNKIIFQPDKLDQSHSFQFSSLFEEHFISVGGGVELNALYFKTAQSSKGLILYFHGNADNLQRWGVYAEDLLPFGYDVLMIDYRGYGKSGGKPNELDLYADAEIVLEWATKNFEFDRLIIYGRSLGTAVASKLAASKNPDWLILETPFDKMRSLVLPPFKPFTFMFPGHNSFSNITHLKSVTCPVLILHGTDDWVTPLSSAVRLKPVLKRGDEFIVIEGGDHKNLREFKEYHTALEKVLVGV